MEKLKVMGTQLCLADNTPIVLHGVSTHGIGWHPEVVCRETFAELKHWGVNAVRLAMYTAENKGYCTNDAAFQCEMKNLVERGVRTAKELGLYTIVDWHILTDGNPVQHQAEAAAFFEEMTLRLADCQNVLYEICNEPNGEEVTWPVIKGYADTILPVIRKNAADAVVIIGTPCWSQWVEQAAENPVEGENLLYSLHFYAGTHKQALRERAKTALQKGLPLIVSEFGICDASGNGALDYASAAEWLAFMEENKLSFLMWNLSNHDESSAMLKADCSKLDKWTDADLNPCSIWLKDVLGKM